jgi:hypothetical protein
MEAVVGLGKVGSLMRGGGAKGKGLAEARRPNPLMAIRQTVIEFTFLFGAQWAAAVAAARGGRNSEGDDLGRARAT